MNLYMSYRTANLQMLHFIYHSTNIRTEYFKHAAHSPFFFSLQNAVYFIMLPFFGSCVIHILYTGGAKIKKKNGAKGLNPYKTRWISSCRYGDTTSLLDWNIVRNLQAELPHVVFSGSGCFNTQRVLPVSHVL